MACCRKTAGMTPSIHARIDVLLHKISTVYPNSYPVLVLHASTSEILAHLPHPPAATGSSAFGAAADPASAAGTTSSSAKHPRTVDPFVPILHHNVASMRRAASQFARSLESNKQAPSAASTSATRMDTSFSNLRTLHVRGTENVFSLYVFDDAILAFYSQNMPRQEVQGLEFLSRDKKLRQEVIPEMRQLLNNLTQGGDGDGLS